MTNEIKYKYATIVLAIIVVILIVTLINKPEPTLNNALKSVGDDLGDCREALANWRAEFGTTTAPLSVDAREALDAAVAACQEKVDDAQATLE